MNSHRKSSCIGDQGIWLLGQLQNVIIVTIVAKNDFVKIFAVLADFIVTMLLAIILTVARSYHGENSHL